MSQSLSRQQNAAVEHVFAIEVRGQNDGSIAQSDH